MEPSEELFNKVIKRIRKEEQMSVLRGKMILAFAVLLGSGFLLWPAFKAVKTSIAESGFGEFLSLIISDFTPVFLFWQSFSLALLESLPAASVAEFLAVFLIFLASLRFFARYAAKILFVKHNLT